MNIYSEDLLRVIHQDRTERIRGDAEARGLGRKLRGRRRDAVPASEAPVAANVRPRAV